MRAAYLQAATSPDVSTQNGAVLVAWDGSVVFGCNSLPMGVSPTEARLQGSAKYDWTVHAEHAVLLHAASQGVSTFGATVYAPWFACVRCAVSMIHSGVTRVVGHASYHHAAASLNSKWNDSIEMGIDALQEAGVVTEWLEGPIEYAPPVLVAGRLFDPCL